MVGGASPYEGRLEVYNRGIWGTVCNDYSFGHVEATVACQSIGSGLIRYFFVVEGLILLPVTICILFTVRLHVNATHGIAVEILSVCSSVDL